MNTSTRRWYKTLVPGLVVSFNNSRDKLNEETSGGAYGCCRTVLHQTPSSLRAMHERVYDSHSLHPALQTLCEQPQ